MIIYIIWLVGGYYIFMKKKYGREFILAITLSILFTITLFYLTLEFPHILDRILRNYYPDLFGEFELIAQMLNSIRPIGYLTLGITIILIVLGFTHRKSYLTIIGTLAIYIPTFGYFAFAMFFLAGIGILRVLWLPLIEYSPDILELGNIALTPYIILRTHSPWTITFKISLLTALIIIFIGLFIFSFGTTTWLYGKFKGYKIIDFWIYKYVRHPQYLGYITWSYGLLIFIYLKPYVRGAFVTTPSYPWLISALMIIGVALYEEIKMKKVYRENYVDYIKRSSFMMPVPKRLTDFVKLPLKVRSGEIEELTDIIIILIIYFIIFTILSYLINIYL